MLTLKAYASGGAGSKRGSKTPSSDFNYTSNMPQYTRGGYPIIATAERGRGYSYNMNGTVWRTPKKKTMTEVDDFFTRRERGSDYLMTL